MPLFPTSAIKTNKADAVRISNGSVVEYEQNGKPILGLVVGQKKERWVVLNSSGHEVELDASRLYLYPGHSPELKDRVEKASYITNLDAEIKDTASKLNLFEAWQLVSGEMNEVSISMLTELICPADSLLCHAAVRRSLLADKLYFKRKKNTLNTPKINYVAAGF